MSYNNHRHQVVRYQPQEFAPQASQTTAISYRSPSYKQHAAQYATPVPLIDEISQWSDTNSVSNVSETTHIPRSEIEKLIHEDTEGDRRRCAKWAQWAREQKEQDRPAHGAEPVCIWDEYRYRREIADRQTQEFEKVKVEADEHWKGYLQKSKASKQLEAERRERSRTNSSRNNHSRGEQATRYVSGVSGRQLSYTPLSNETLINIAKESNNRGRRRY
ncbi:hypothetical protein BOTCAL_0176g00030 [Botryotinia calthae]|uniref:Uncharacterized protein n=1 Tax=Botryotinia calthae TaxID=38488 RepID=A0A4Y8D0Y9_9HELO|nr:hypothetical protein BOTCAL_0176g00030 [Botryotinia calthae]